MGFVRDGESILLHGKSSSFLMQRMSSREPICVTVTLLDGLVMARSAFNHSMNYRSVVIFGQPEPILEQDEKLHAMLKLTDGLTYQGRWDELRPTTPAELLATSVVRLELKEVSAKVRAHGVGDEAEDLRLARDLSLDPKDPRTKQARCWAGIIPVKLVSFEPVDDKDQTSVSSKPAERAAHLERVNEGIVPISRLQQHSPGGNHQEQAESRAQTQLTVMRLVNLGLVCVIGALLFKQRRS